MKHCMTMEVDCLPRKTWWNCVKYDMKSLSQEDTWFRNKWRSRSKWGNRLAQVSLEKWPLKRSVCVCVYAVALLSLLDCVDGTLNPTHSLTVTHQYFCIFIFSVSSPSVLRHCSLGDRKGIWIEKNPAPAIP